MALHRMRRSRATASRSGAFAETSAWSRQQLCGHSPGKLGTALPQLTWLWTWIAQVLSGDWCAWPQQRCQGVIYSQLL